MDANESPSSPDRPEARPLARPKRRLTTPLIGLVALAAVLIVFAVVQSRGPTKAVKGLPAEVRRELASAASADHLAAPGTWVTVSSNSTWSDEVKEQIPDPEGVLYVAQVRGEGDGGDGGYLLFPVRAAADTATLAWATSDPVDLSGLGEVHTLSQEDLDSLN
ncbi:hypothetical protein [Kineosporia succinea]|uniref:DUF4245 family protein n=1 Tax=Kineosporia succinea TaxID=84632 RepID=A0ABT9P0D1_9ACTN|nr:hypothetical protein [Kineosporia succinea]MDP9826137.1 hypothetical protein [Kineosporia succinea]